MNYPCPDCGSDATVILYHDKPEIDDWIGCMDCADEDSFARATGRVHEGGE